MRLKAELFPYDDLDVNDGLESLNRVGLITRYERGDMRVIAIPKWLKHQQPNIREPISELPPDGSGTVPAPDEHTGKGREGKGKEGVLASLVVFERFWLVYPRKTAKDAARKEWLRLNPDEPLTELMIAKVYAFIASPQWTKDGGQYIPHARTWLHQRRWEDDVVQPASVQGVAVARKDQARARYGV